MPRILCIAPGGLGDQIISLSGLRYLRTVFPPNEIELRIAAWTSRRELLRLCLGPSLPIRSLDSLWRLRNRKVSLRSYDWILDFDTTDGEFLTRLPNALNARQNVFSFAKTQRFQNQVSCERDDISGSPFWQRCFDMAFRVASHICETSYSRDIMVACADQYRTVSLPQASSQVRQRVRRLLSHGKAGQARLAVSPGGYSPEHKLWPIERFGETIEHAVSRGTSVFVLGSAQEAYLSCRLFDYLKANWKKLDTKNSGNVTFLTGQLSLEELPYVLQEMHMHLSNDNGVAHIGGLLNRPQVILYRGRESKHRSVGFRDVALFSGDRSGMTALATATVIEQFEKLIHLETSGWNSFSPNC